MPQDPTAPPSLLRRALPILGLVGGMVVGATLLFGAWAKLLDPDAFGEQVVREGLDFLLSAQTVAFLALGLEIALGASLLLGLRRLWILVPAAFLVAFFLFLTGRAYWNFAHGVVDDSGSCGCFGNLVERSPAEAFWQDLLLLVPGLAVAFLGRSGGAMPRLRLGAVGLLTAAGLVFAVQSPELPLDDLATRLKPGTQVDEICAGQEELRVCLTSIMPELEEGEHLVVLADLEDPAFGEAVDALNQYLRRGDGPRLWVLSSSPPEAHHSFFWQWGPSFEIREAPESLLRSLYRRLPRSCRVLQGEVLETYSGLPPLPAAEGEAAAETT